MPSLGKLVRVSALRKTWPDEARDFTPWLAEPDNISILSETLGLGDDGLDVEATEYDVGPFRADILCRLTNKDARVLIENQLERTDHRHLGQILTYAAGLNAQTIVWIAARFTQEHRAALDWLNEMSSDEHRFFGLEIELWQIGDSAIAPRFNVVASPNEWSREVDRIVIPSSQMTPLRQLQKQYWSEFAAVLEEHGGPPRPAAPQPTSFITHSIGKANVFLNAGMHSRENWVRGEIYLTGKDAKSHFDQLYEQRREIESAFDAELDWQRLPEKQDCRVCYVLEQADLDNQSDWPRQHKWLADVLVRMHQSFNGPIRDLGNIAQAPEAER